MKKNVSMLLGVVMSCFLVGCNDGKCDKCKEEAYEEWSGKEYCIECYFDEKYQCAICGDKGYSEYEGKNYCSDCYEGIRLNAFDKEKAEQDLLAICKKYSDIEFLNVEFDLTTFIVPVKLNIKGFEKLTVEQQFAFYDKLRKVDDIYLTLISDNSTYKVNTYYNGYYKTVKKDGVIIYEYPGDPADTEYNDLTVYQKYLICMWIEGQYEAYDKMAGGYTGDKYTKDIFSAAADKYNKTYTQINTIWSELYDIKDKLGLYNN